MRLNRRRRALAERAAQTDAEIAAVEAIIEQLYGAADDDLAVLDHLLVAQREAKQTGERAAYRNALFAAAESPLRMVDTIQRLLDHVATHTPLSSRFTVSDMAAAATLAEGAARAALATAEVNLALLRDEAEVDRQRLSRLVSAAGARRQAIVALAQDIEHRARVRIQGDAFNTQEH
jgi:formiminotetrahydrofolate cyclodeaminase